MERDIDFGVNSFGRGKVLPVKETIANLFMNILFMEKGQLPSLPHIGIGISSILYKTEEEIDFEHLTGEIQTQASTIMPYINVSNLEVRPINVGEPTEAILIKVPLLVDEDMYIKLAKGEKPGDPVRYVYTFNQET